ncbi:MAG TPA: hypothetical protein VN426_08105 [Syntrophomonadaceae bacterium]|nr:hypothetical protein [Syntrophomonadaceae bacterium]
MHKGDLFTVYMEGVTMTVCILGFYEEEFSGKEMVVLAVVDQESMVHLPLNDLEVLFPRSKNLN